MRYEMTKTWQNMKTISVFLNSTGQSTGFETLKLIDPDVPQDFKFQLEGGFILLSELSKLHAQFVGGEWQITVFVSAWNLPFRKLT